MDYGTFRSFMNRARVAATADGDDSEYWLAYQRGLRRLYHGDQFGDDAEDAAMAKLADRRGEGYRAGLAGTEPRL